MTISKYSFLLLAISSGWLGFLFLSPELVGQWAAFWVTVGLIGLNFLSSLFTLIKLRHILVLPNLVQPVLFCLLSYQLFLVDGSQNYQYDREPRLLDWMELTAVHLLRAVDILDGLEAYGVDLQNVKSESIAAGLVLVSLHLCVDIFLISVVIRLLIRSWKKRVSRVVPVRQHWLRYLTIGSWVVCIAGIVLVVLQGDWPPRDWFLWPLDNVLRLLDIGDAFQIFRWRLHQVPSTAGTATLAIGFRFLAGLHLAEGLAELRFRFGGLGLTMDELLEQLKDPHLAPHRRKRLTYLLASTPSRALVEKLIGLLDHGDPLLMQVAAEALGRLGPSAAPALPALIHKFVYPEKDVQEEVAWAIVKLKEVSIPELIQVLGGSGWVAQEPFAPRLQQAAADLLGRFGKYATVAIGPLIGARVSSHGPVRHAAQGALFKINKRWAESLEARSVLPALFAALTDSDVRTRERSARALAELRDQIGSEIDQVVPGLVDCSPRVQQECLKILTRAGNQAERIVPQLTQYLEDSDANICLGAALALAEIGKAANAAIPQLVKALNHPKKAVRQASARALGKMKKQARPAITPLVLAFADEVTSVHQAAKQALTSINPSWRTTEEAQAAIPHLKKIRFQGKQTAKDRAASLLHQLESKLDSPSPSPD